MAKLGLISKHIVLSECNGLKPRYPCPGIILIQEDLIADIILTETDSDFQSLFELYADWNPVDYSDLYISPGLIDLHARTEWESLSKLTRESLKGGVTLVVVEPGRYIDPSPAEDFLYCDVMKIEVINENTDFENIESRASVLKAFLYPPASQVKSVSHLQYAIQKAAETRLPLFIDATSPDERLIYMASPMRLENLEERGAKTTLRQDSYSFATSIPHNIVESSSENDDSVSELSPPPIRTSSLKTAEGDQKGLRHFSICHESIPQLKNLSISTPTPVQIVERSSGKKITVGSIYDDLDSRIEESESNLEDLIHAEKNTYIDAGQTSYEPIKKSHSMSLSPAAVSPLLQSHPTSFVSKLSLRTRGFQLAPLETKSNASPDRRNEYTHHLANYPVHWETSGINNVLESISAATQVHFVGLSSAPAINSIRKARKKHKNITCEIPAILLCFTSALVKEGDTRFKNSPPVRNSANCNLLWELLKVKAIDCICSAHAYICPEKKLTNNFLTALNGISCIGCSLQSVWYILNKPVSSHDQLEHYIIRLSKWFSLHPAQILGISSSRGSISKGKLADFIVWDPHVKHTLGQEYSYFDTSPFAGHDMLGNICYVYLRGRLAMDRNDAKPFGSDILNLRG